MYFKIIKKTRSKKTFWRSSLKLGLGYAMLLGSDA